MTKATPPGAMEIQLDEAGQPGIAALRQPRGLFRCFLVLVTIGFPLSVAWLIFHYAVDVPVEDQWSQLPLLDRYLAGEMTFVDWISPHREHRLLVPRLVWFPLARATGLNVRAEAAAGYLFALATYSILAFWVWRLPLDSLRRWSMLAILSLTMFGWQPWENWLWGSQIQTFSSLLFVVIGLRALTAERISGWSFGLAALSGSLALYCQATAFVFWGVGSLLLFARVYEARTIPRRRARSLWFLLLWIGLAIGHSLIYRVGGIADADRLSAVVGSPGPWLAYALVFLGSPLVGYGKALHPFGPVAPGMVAGVLGVGLFVAACWRSRALLSSSSFRVFLGALGSYSAGVALLVGLGRVGEGVAQAYASRYTSYSLLLWLATLLLLALEAEPRSGTASAPRGFRQARQARAAGWLAVAISAALVASSLGSLPLYRRVHGFLVEERSRLGSGTSDLNADQALIEQGIEIMKRRRLSVFRER